MKPRILLVEDETAFAVGVIDRLESEGYQVEWARPGRRVTKWRWRARST